MEDISDVDFKYLKGRNNFLFPFVLFIIIFVQIFQSLDKFIFAEIKIHDLLRIGGRGLFPLGVEIQNSYRENIGPAGNRQRYLKINMISMA